MQFYLLIIFLLFTGTAFAEEMPDPRTHRVVVSIAPYKFFVDALAGDSVKVELLVPPGTSFHDYEPTPRQVLNVSYADLWFRIGESFENRALNALRSHNPRMRVIDLRDGINLITIDSGDKTHACPHCLASGADLHFWLSPKQVKIQAQNITKALMQTYPEYTNEFQQRLDKLLTALDSLDYEIAGQLAPLKQRVIMVGHPAYAYFARDYNLVQLPIEYEGREPSPRQLNNTLNQARKIGIKRIYVQPQHSKKGATLLAKELGAEVVELDPYSGDYFNSMREIADNIASQESTCKDK